VCIDSCKDGLRGVLIQEGHVIFYESIKLNEHEVNYATHDMEFDSIVHALKICRHYLLGRRFVLMTNHRGLRHFVDKPKLNVRQDKWMDLLSEFDFEIKHIKGKENMVVDSLGRSMKEVHLEVVCVSELDIKERVKSAQLTYAFLKTVTSYLKQEPTCMNYKGY
jgi:hypothetical protein